MRIRCSGNAKSAYKEFNQSNNQIGCWPWKMIGKVKIPYKVACFTWLLAREAVLTQDNLLKRGYQLGSRCHLCEAQEETVNHLFLHCRVTDQLWKIFINLRGIQCLMLGRIKEVLTSWKRDGDHSRQKERWKIVPACIWWTIWKERNQRCFEDNHSSIQTLKMSCLMLFYFWCNQEYLEEGECIFDVLDQL